MEIQLFSVPLIMTDNEYNKAKRNIIKKYYSKYQILSAQTDKSSGKQSIWEKEQEKLNILKQLKLAEKEELTTLFSHKKAYDKGLKKLRPKSHYISKTPSISKEERVYNDYVKSALARNKAFELTLEEFNTFKIDAYCTYCGSPSLGIDRVENSIGYIMSNCVPCCGQCNRMKYTGTTEEFLEQVKKIYEFNFK